VNNFGTILFVLFLGDPLRFKGGERGECRSTGPDGVVSVLSSNDLDHVLLWAHGIEFFLKSIWKTLIKSSTTGENDVTVEFLSDINVTLLDGFESHLVHTKDFITLLDKVWEEDSFWTHESWGVNLDGLSIWKLVVFGEFTRVGSFLFISGGVK